MRRTGPRRRRAGKPRRPAGRKPWRGAQAYYHENGEWEWETQAREQAALARAEARADEQRRAETAERQQVRYAQLIAAGHRPRTVGEILAVAALYP